MDTTALADFWNTACAVVSDMEAAGCHFDTTACQAAHARAASDLYPLGNTWRELAGEVNPASPVQLAKLLYETRKFPLPPVAGGLKAVKKRKPDEEPTSEAALDWLWRKAKKPENKLLLRTLLDLRRITKLAQFLEKLPQFVHDGVLYASFGPDTGTGRLASRNPNLQNIPGGDPYGIRACFVAPPGMKLLVADYSALEPRIMAHYLIQLFGDHTFADAINSGDIYSAVACRTWPDKLRGISPHEVKEHHDPSIRELRKIAKVIVLGKAYGKTVPGFAVQLGISTEEAKAFDTAYCAAYPGIPAFQEWSMREYRAGRLRTLLGRTRILEAADDYRIQRQATNTIIQGSAADIVFAAMVAQRDLPGTLQMQLHDELNWRIPADMDPAPLLRAMEHPFTIDLSIDFPVTYKLCDNWGQAK